MQHKDILHEYIISKAKLWDKGCLFGMPFALLAFRKQQQQSKHNGNVPLAMLCGCMRMCVILLPRLLSHQSWVALIASDLVLWPSPLLGDVHVWTLDSLSLAFARQHTISSEHRSG